ncbi:MAG: hypothetical protein ACLQVD_08090 [Capsulimonadaceae bacterium]
MSAEPGRGITPSGKGSGRSRTLYYGALFLFTVVAAVWQGYTANATVFEASASHQLNNLSVEIGVDNVDTLRSVYAHPTLLSTLGWLHESWHGNRVPFYWRPLSMFAFWIENAACGRDLTRWVDVTIELHALFAVMLVLLADRLARGVDPIGSLTPGNAAAAILTALIFTESIPVLRFLNADFALSGAEVVLVNWKDQVEMWTGTAILASVIFSMGGAWKPALACAVAAVCCKESGWLAFMGPLLVPILRPSPSDNGNGSFDIRVPAAWIAAAAILVALRASAGWGVFHAPTATGGHLHVAKYVCAVIDVYTAMLATNTWPIPLLGASFGVIAVARGLSSRARLGLCSAAAALAVFALALTSHVDAPSAIMMIVSTWEGLRAMLMSVAYAAVVMLAFRTPGGGRKAVFLYVLVLITATPTLTVNQPNMHMLYLTNGVQCILIASCLSAAACALRSTMPVASRTVRN